MLPKALWAHTYKHSIYLHNHTGHTALGGKTPYEVRFGTPPDIRHLRPWGARVWVKQDGHKLDPRGAEGRFVGFSENHRDAVHVYWPERRNVTVVRDFVWARDAPSEASTRASEGARVEESEREAGDEGEDENRANARSGTEEQSEGSMGDILEEAPREEQLGRGHRIKKPSYYVRRLQSGEGTADGKRS
ncbi:hypothetical protein C8Q77DRAFT_1066627, partial [Trametes polyzona]